MEKFGSCHDGHELFRIAKQNVGEKKDAVREKRDVVGVSCHKHKSGAVKINADDRKKIWN